MLSSIIQVTNKEMQDEHARNRLYYIYSLIKLGSLRLILYITVGLLWSF